MWTVRPEREIRDTLPLGLLLWVHVSMTDTSNLSRRKWKRSLKPGVQIGVRLQDDDIAALDAWRKEQPDLPTRAEAARKLIQAGLRSGVRSEGVGRQKTTPGS